MVGIAAMNLSQGKRQINIEQDIVPEDLRELFNKAYKN